MATTAVKLTAERAHEFWYGEAIPKGTPNWIHGLLQGIILQLLKDTGFHAACEVELRIDPNAHPRPDVIASRHKPREAYPTRAAEIVVEIVSEDELFPHLKDKCRKYKAWGFERVFVVDPSDRSVAEWTGALTETQDLAGIPVERIWRELDSHYGGE